jgi:catechol 2,3-dioxygenase-like lactoylglutathione lyase family enzyme
MSLKFAVIALWAEDVVGCLHFYQDVLGLTLSAEHGPQPHFQVDGVYLVIRKGIPRPASNADRFPLFALAVDQLDEMVPRLAAHDVALPWGVEGNANARWVMFHDPAGNLIELVQLGK